MAPGPMENKLKCHSPKLMCLKLQPEEEQALQKTCVIRQETDNSLEKIWYFSWSFLCNSSVLGFGCLDLTALSLTQSCRLSSLDRSGPWRGKQLEAPGTSHMSKRESWRVRGWVWRRWVCLALLPQPCLSRQPTSTLLFILTWRDFPLRYLLRAVGFSRPLCTVR